MIFFWRITHFARKSTLHPVHAATSYKTKPFTAHWFLLPTFWLIRKRIWAALCPRFTHLHTQIRRSEAISPNLNATWVKSRAFRGSNRLRSRISQKANINIEPISHESRSSFTRGDTAKAPCGHRSSVWLDMLRFYPSLPKLFLAERVGFKTNTRPRFFRWLTMIHTV